ncbi:hypothetical protein TSUD_140410 [Trifolium subterraneum]|uniref:Uncharacterized protein n=1 Tax=Trifolium subterraneum TaxID=3900 RepID=A0A2Z6NG96_TRISU|nr:hypothetical protein TSUD_140410 [Trifolium subterraneum]
MPERNMNEMLEVIESKFEFVPPINDLTREMIKSDLNDKWKQWKCDLKAMPYDPSKTEEEIASEVPDARVDKDQFRELVHYWFSDEGQMKKGKGVIPERHEIYIETRTRKDGSIVNEKAAKLIEGLNKCSNEAGTSQSAQNMQGSIPWRDVIFFKVQGPAKKGCEQYVNDIIQAARQVTDASSAPNHFNSPSPDINEDNENGEEWKLTWRLALEDGNLKMKVVDY